MRYYFLLFFCCVSFAFAQERPIYPDAVGASVVEITAGVGGDICFVTNLNDTGAGSLRNCVEDQGNTNRVVLFRVGGIINLQSKLLVTNDESNIRISFQSAPSPVLVQCKNSDNSTSPQRNGQCFDVHGGKNGLVENGFFMNGIRSYEDLRDIQSVDTVTLYSSGTDSATQTTNWYFRGNFIAFGQDEIVDIGGFGGQCTIRIVFHDNIIGFPLQQNAGHFDATLIYYCADANDADFIIFVGNILSGGARIPDFKGLKGFFGWNILHSVNRSFSVMATRGATHVNFINNALFGCPSGFCFAARENTGSEGVDGGPSGNPPMNYYLNNINVNNRNSTPKVKKINASNYSISEYVQTPVGTPIVHDWVDEEDYKTADEVIAELVADTKRPKILDEDGSFSYVSNSLLTKLRRSILLDDPVRAGSETALGGYGSFPTVATYPTDTDDDGMYDHYEERVIGLDKTVADDDGDIDSDGYTNLEEFLNGTSERIFLPYDIDGGLAWFDGSDGSTVTLNGVDKVSAIVDKFNGITASQAVLANQPTYNGGFLTSTGDNDEHLVLDTPIEGAKTVFIVYRNFLGGTDQSTYNSSYLFDSTPAYQVSNNSNDYCFMRGGNDDYHISCDGFSGYDDVRETSVVYFNSITNYSADADNPVINSEAIPFPNRSTVDVVLLEANEIHHWDFNELFSSDYSSGSSIDIVEWVVFDRALTSTQKEKMFAFYDFKYETPNITTTYTAYPIFE